MIQPNDFTVTGLIAALLTIAQEGFRALRKRHDSEEADDNSLRGRVARMERSLDQERKQRQEQDLAYRVQSLEGEALRRGWELDSGGGRRGPIT